MKWAFCQRSARSARFKILCTSCVDFSNLAEKTQAKTMKMLFHHKVVSIIFCWKNNQILKKHASAVKRILFEVVCKNCMFYRKCVFANQWFSGRVPSTVRWNITATAMFFLVGNTVRVWCESKETNLRKVSVFSLTAILSSRVLRGLNRFGS